MAIPKKYKRQIKAAMKSSPEPVATAKMTWSFTTGDLVEYKGLSGVIVEDRGDGWYLLMGPSGRAWRRATKLKKIQNAPEDSDTCKKET